MSDHSGDLNGTYGEGLSYAKMPGHWLLARLGKRVLRPGGLALTQGLLDALCIQTTDSVVEFAPGLGVTARLTLARNPGLYTAIERDQVAATSVGRYLTGPQRRCLVGSAEHTGLPDGYGTIAYGEALLTMQTPAHKRMIVQEARRILRPGGRYGIHELCLVPDDIDTGLKQEIQKALAQVLRVNARPLTPSEWRQLLECEGLAVVNEALAPALFLETRQFIRDEGIWGSLRFTWNSLRNPTACRRVFQMWQVFRKYRQYLGSIMLVAVKPGTGAE